MKKLSVYPQKNALSEIKVWLGENDFELVYEEEWKDGLIDIFFPENKKEEKSMLETIYADASNRRYPDLLTLKSVNVDCSDYIHEIRHTSLGSSSWKVIKNKKDVSKKFSELLSKLESMDSGDIDEYLGMNDWQLDLQYFFIKAIQSVK